MKQIVFLIAALLLPLSSFAADKPLIRVSYSVTASDAVSQSRITLAVTERLKKNPLFDVRDDFAEAKIFVFANQNTKENINPDGWSFAVAFTNNYESFYLANKLLDSDLPEIEAVKPTIVSMVRDEGFLRHLNVAYLDDLSDEKLAIVADAFVSRFVANFK